jgi:hypothetical protein
MLSVTLISVCMVYREGVKGILDVFCDKFIMHRVATNWQTVLGGASNFLL